ncbi:MAG TPA: 2-phosphosulfolactate phosphatase, partial [Candidatus Poseidoniales archaeon]|nr:2-phosphosulfolactate phosphatase [Candidatus Poseidoniales archaeon]
MRITIEQGLLGAEAAAARGDATVIIDVIRASTTYATALAGGAERIVPCASRAHLEEVRQRYPEALRSGERECKRIEGYDLGSSPTEMAAADLRGRTLLSSTTNGSRMVVAA